MASEENREAWILRQARERPPHRRADFLDGACAGDEALRRRVEELLVVADFANGGVVAQLEISQLTKTADFGGPLDSETIGQALGRYKLLEKIGEGGWGVVYVAEQSEPVRRRVALKVIKLGMDTRAVVARFQAERQALAMMDHPNIAKVFDAGATEQGRPYFVMELVRGIPITQYCDQNNLTTQQRLELFIKVCQAIQHAHQKGIIHRDIKPSNVLVTLHDGVPVPKVIDFGIAKATEGRLTDVTVYTQLNQFVGTPAYMSPEQAEMSGLDIDTRSDIYSLGVLLYELLTGRTPFDPKELVSQGIEAMAKRIRETEPLRPSTKLGALQREELTATAKRRSADSLKLLHQLRGDLDWISMKCLEKDRTRRYETANGLALDIQRHLANEPVLARPPSLTYQLQKSFRRNRLVFTAAGAVTVALVMGVMVSTWEAIRATIEKKRADLAAQEATREGLRAAAGEQKAKESERRAKEYLYAADMNLAYQASQDGNLGLALDLLNRHRPAAQEQDLRGWEWRYMWGLCQSEALYTLGRHTNVSQGVYGIAISHDDKYLATADGGEGGGKGEVRLWDIASRRLVEILETNDANTSVVFSPDGKSLAFATVHKGVRLWDVEGHHEITRFPEATLGGFNGPNLGFSPDGRKLAIGKFDGRVILWDLAKREARDLLASPSYIHALFFSPDGHALVTTHGDLTVRVWSVATGQQIAVLTNNTSRLAGVALSPDGKTLAAGDWDNRIRILDLTEQRQLAVLTNHTRWVSALAFSPDGKTMGSASADCSIKLWDTSNWQEVATLRGSRDEVYGIVFSADGSTLFSGIKDGNVLAWDGRPKLANARALRKPGNAQAFALVSSGRIPYCGYSNNTFNLWEPLTLHKLTEHQLSEPEVLTNSIPLSLDWNSFSLSLGFSPGGERLAMATRSGRIYLWDVEQERKVAWLDGWPSDSTLVQFSSDGRLLAALAAGKGLKLYDANTLKVIATLPKSDEQPSCEPCFSTNGQMVAVGNYGGTVEVWNLKRKERTCEWRAHGQIVSGMTFMPDGKRLVTVSLDSTARLWDLDTRPPRELQSFGRTF
jgi:WD40 repeat protein/serine/threonine protein kinase